jgi:hypothetical protein
MSLFKTLAVIAGVTAVGYAAYKVAKAHPDAAVAVLNALATPPAPAAKVVVVEVVEVQPAVTVVHDVVKVKASHGEGVMSVAAVVQEEGVTVEVDDFTGEVIVTEHVPAFLREVSYREGEAMVGSYGSRF